MGWFDSRSSASGGAYVRKRERSPSRRSTSGYSTHHSRHSAPSIFSFSGSRTGRSSPSVFSSTSSSRRARPRSGFIQRIIRYIRRLFRDISSYARKHPMKVLMLVVVPLITSGVLVKLFAMIGIHLPKHIFGGSSSSSSSRSGGDGGMAGNINGLMNIAKMLM